MKVSRTGKRICIPVLAAAVICFVLASVFVVRKYNGRSAVPYDGKKYIRAAVREEVPAVPEKAQLNTYSALSVPTDVTRIAGDYFIVDCYHDQILTSTDLSAPLDRWSVVTSEISEGHTIAGDGTVFLADDTGGNRVLIFEKKDGVFVHTQTFSGIGNKPHYIVYDEKTDTFYCWSSFSGEMYLFRRKAGTGDVYLTEIRKVAALEKRYVRSFTIEGNRILFVSGLPYEASETAAPSVLVCSLSSFRVLKEYTVPDAIAGMSQIEPVLHDAGSSKDPLSSPEGYLVTVSTDLSGSQNAATILWADSLEDLTAGKYRDLYTDNFIGGGTPYYIGYFDGRYYLTEHRLPDHAVWSFLVRNGAVADVQSVF